MIVRLFVVAAIVGVVYGAAHAVANYVDAHAWEIAVLAVGIF
jgi:hypothetical protein